MSEDYDMEDYKDAGENESTTSEFKYTPQHFLRCHSKIKDDAADIQTDVWQCAFEPNPDYTEKTTNYVATCGGNSLCVTNVKDGKIKTKYYSRDRQEVFYTVAWASLTMKINEKFAKSNILAVGGQRCTLHLIHPSNHVCFFEKTLRKRSKKVGLTFLLFNPLNPSVLFGSFSDGEVCVWSIGQPSPPKYEVDFKALKTFSIPNEVNVLAYSRHCEVLLAATDDGVVGWPMPARDISDKSSEPQRWRFTFPLDQKPGLVDSLEPIENGKVIATKCALHGAIYLWDLEIAMLRGKNVAVKPDHILKWSSTDNYYMNMGSHMLSGILGCGDDRGHLWLYNVADILSQSQREHGVSTILEWPEIEDPLADGQRKVRQDLHDIVVNKVAINHSSNYIVAVTGTNLVCIWKREEF